MVLDLVKTPDLFQDYKLTTSSGVIERTNSSKQMHFRGIVRGNEETSLVALSVFEDEVMGFISIKGSRTLNIGKLRDEDLHVLFSDEDLNFPTGSTSATDCETSSEYYNEKLDEIYSKLGPQSSTSPNIKSLSEMKADGNHLQVYVETDFDIYQNLENSISNVENFVTGLFNQIATLYNNEDIFIQISEIFIWETSDSYSSSVSVGLSNFVASRPTFNGDLAILLSYRDGDDNPNNTSNAGGRANGIGGLCVTGNSSLSPHAHISLFPEFENFPTFSRQVKVVTHEMGHNLGSRHTHACVWNGNNTAIDGCVGSTEGSCSVPSDPVDGGTIMSYCDRRPVGIDFNLGFGAQPGTVIRNMVVNADCLDCDLEIINRNITTNLTIQACDVEMQNVTIENNVELTINYSGNVTISGTFEAELGTTLDIDIQ